MKYKVKIVCDSRDFAYQNGELSRLQLGSERFGSGLEADQSLTDPCLFVLLVES